MKARFIAHWFCGGSNHDSMTASTLEALYPFIKERKAETRESKGGLSLCVADLRSKAEDWLWKMESGGRVTYNTRSKYGRQAARLFGC